MSNPSNYRVSLKLSSKTYTKIAPTIVEALETLQPDYITKSKGILSVTHNKLKAKVLLWPVQMKKLFTDKTARLIFQKRILGALK